MKLESLKDLDKLLLLCKKRGVKTMKIDNLEFHLDPTPVTSSKTTNQLKETGAELNTPGFMDPGPITPPAEVATDSLTDEQLLFYSAQGHVPVEQ